MTSPVDETSPQLDALVELGRNQPGQHSRAELSAGLSQVTARLEAHRSRRLWLRRAAPLVALMVVGGALLFVLRGAGSEPAPLTYEVRGGVVLDAGYVRESNGAGVVLTFQEGTTFKLASGARARLRAVDALGARLGLESGKASFQVTPDAGRRWEVEVGPFLVQVKGTTFDVTWAPESEVFELELRHGRVLVTGPLSGGALTLNGGQRLVIRLASGETVISNTPDVSQGAHAATDALEPAVVPEPEVASSDGPSPAVAPTNPSSARGDAPSERSASNAVAAGARPRDWARALARGHWEQIVSEAEALGVPTVLATASAEELFTLANAARYRNRGALATSALHALRERFASSSRATDAAFLLGRVAEARGEVTAALSWYAEYLKRAPSGAYAAEALGRKMTLLSRSQGVTSSRAVAEEYLRRYPGGSYAAAARTLLGNSPR